MRKCFPKKLENIEKFLQKQKIFPNYLQKLKIIFLLQAIIEKIVEL